MTTNLDVNDRVTQMRWQLSAVTAELFKRWPLIELAPRDKPVAGFSIAMLSRIANWLGTLICLEPPQRFVQAYAVAARAILESTVDLVLLVSDPTRITKYEWWEASAKLLAAEEWGANQPAEAARWVAANEAVVRENRRRLWSTDRHKTRWTGNSLRFDIREADRVRDMHLTPNIQMIAHLNWFVHGSGILVNVLNDETLAEILHITQFSCYQCTMPALLLTEEATGIGGRASLFDVAKLDQRLKIEAQQAQLRAIASTK